MKRNFLLVALFLSLNACGNKEAPAPAAPAPEMVKQVIVAQQKAEMAEKQRQNEERLRQEAENQKKIAEEEKAKSQYVIMGLVVLVAIALFVGIAIGSSSRKDAARRKDDNAK
jgi:hypothetical protein